MSAVACVSGHCHWVLYVAWSPDGKKLASGCKNGDVSIISVAINSWTCYCLFIMYFLYQLHLHRFIQ